MSEDRSTAKYRSKSHREKISQAACRRWQEYYANGGGELPDRKRCSGPCGLVKSVPEDFYLRKRKLKSGGFSITTVSECKDCSRERARLLREGKTPEQRSVDHKRWNENRDMEAVRVYMREYGRFRRVLAGAKSRGGWIKYRGLPNPDIRVSRAPFKEVIGELGISNNELARITGLHESTFRVNNKTVLLSVVDQTFTALGMHDQVSVVYPLEESSEAA